MPKCTLCLVNEADKTGSHIVPHFLMKTIDNADHTKGRDKELGFKITDDFVKPYFGRDVGQDKLDTVFGELSDEDIAASRSEIIADHIYCSYCEKRFGAIESAYAPTLEIYNSEPYSLKDPLTCFLFWTSLVWRISAYGKLGFKLTKKEEGRLRKILDEQLGKNTVQDGVKGLIDNIRYVIIRAPKYADQNDTATFYHPSHRFPYCFMFGEYVLFYYLKAVHVYNQNQLFFGLEKKIKTAPLNSYNSGEYILPITTDEMHSVWILFVDFVNDKRLKNIFSKLDKLHVMLGGYGKHMDPKDKVDILMEILDEGKALGRAFTYKDITQSTIKILIKNHGVLKE